MMDRPKNIDNEFLSPGDLEDLKSWVAYVQQENSSLRKKVSQHIIDRDCGAKTTAEMCEIIISQRAQLAKSEAVVNAAIAINEIYCNLHDNPSKHPFNEALNALHEAIVDE